MPAKVGALSDEVIAGAACARGARQKRGEFARLVGMVRELEPRVIIEIGCDSGATMWAWRMICPTVYGIDTGPGGTIKGDSHQLTTYAALCWQLAGRPIDFLFIDGDHSYDGVERDWEMYSPLVRPGGLVAFHDICNHGDRARPEVEVDRFWRTLTGRLEPIPGLALWSHQEIIERPKYWGGIGVIYV